MLPPPTKEEALSIIEKQRNKSRSKSKSPDTKLQQNFNYQ
jgi:hypothetical protein